MRIAAEVDRVDRDEAQDFGRPLGDLLVRHRRMRLAGVAHLLAHGHHRVEGVHGALHDDREVPPADVAELLVAHLGHLLAAEGDAPAGDAGGRGEQLADGEHERRLAATGLADDGEELSTVEVEVDVVDGHDRSVVGGVGDREVADLEQLARRRRGAARRRSPARRRAHERSRAPGDGRAVVGLSSALGGAASRSCGGTGGAARRRDRRRTGRSAGLEISSKA